MLPPVKFAVATTKILQDLHAAMKMLGLNPMEQEIIDLTNNIVRNGYIYFPEFCKVIHEKYRQDDEEIFSQNMFKVLNIICKQSLLFIAPRPEAIQVIRLSP